MPFLHKRLSGTKGGTLRVSLMGGEWQRQCGKGLLLATKYFAKQPGLQSQYCQDWLEGANIDFHLHILGTVKHTGFLLLIFSFSFSMLLRFIACKLRLVWNLLLQREKLEIRYFTF